MKLTVRSAKNAPFPLNSTTKLKHGFHVRSSQLLLEERCSSTLAGAAAGMNGVSATSHSDTSEEFNSFAYAAMFQECIQTGDLDSGRGRHCEIVKRGHCLDLFASNILLNMYVKSDLLIDDALNLFEEMPHRNTISFVTLINGCMKLQHYAQAVNLVSRIHQEGHELNPFVFTTILKLLVSLELGEAATSTTTRNIHGCIYKLGHHSNPFVGTALVEAYSNCGGLIGPLLARRVFDEILHKDMVSWTGMVACCAENGNFQDAMELFAEMRMAGMKPNNFTFAGVIKACLATETIAVGKSIHSCTVKTCYHLDLYVSLALLDLYTKSGDMNSARQLFDEIPQKNVVHWSCMIARYAQTDRAKEAITLFCRMRQDLILPNQFTLASLLQASATMEGLDLGKQIHAHAMKVGLDSVIFVSNALMDAYAKCGRIHDTVKLFVDIPNRNDVTWNTMIVGYVQSGECEKALDSLSKMLECGLRATKVTYSSILRACASLAALEPGIQIHSLAVKSNFDHDVMVGNSLIDMYAKCGTIKDARLIFDAMNEKDEVSWNVMISGYSMHGLCVEAVSIFKKMQEMEFRPDKFTFVGILSACSNTGMLDQGQDYFNAMVNDYGIEPCVEHYTCMVGLLGRSGHLNKALKLIEEIPFEPSVMVWRALLAACVMHKNIEVGRLSAHRVLEIDPQDEATHVLLSNMYASARRWDNVAFVRESMKKKGVKKDPGLSWIENQGTVHYFTVGDTSHPDMKLINGMLEWLKLKTRKEGYVPDFNTVLFNLEKEEKEHHLWLHSERLALAFAIIRTPPGSPIRIIKNLRICVDCHTAILFISKFVQRDIVVRDINRFHHFQGGICSCAGYW